MYAQLCKRLSEEAPNFEPPGQPCTFKLLLLNKCRAEFENRAQTFAAFEEKEHLTPEEEERRHLAKCKMLGNIKFIGELGKLEILAESILHRCIQNLLARRAAAEHHEDLECLAQLVRTCGRVLDSERGRGLMDQYFARIETLSASRELAPRIRFMLRDVVELRRGGWVPRAAAASEGPVPIQQLRADEEPPPPRRDPLFRSPAPRPRPLDDVLAGLALQPPSLPGLPPSQDKLFGNGFPRDAFRQRSAPGYYNRGGQHHKGGGGGGGKETAPRLNKSRLAAAAPLTDVQMRPAANSLMFIAKGLTQKQPPPAHATLAMQPAPQQQQSTLAATFASAPPLLKEPAIAIKPAPDKKDKPKKDKGMNKEEACRVLVEAAAELDAEAGAGADEAAREAAVKARVQRLRDMALPEKLLRRALANLLEHALNHPPLADLPEDERGGAESGAVRVSGWAACALARGVKRAPLGDTLRALLARPHARLPALLAHALAEKLVTLSEVVAACEGGAHRTLLLELLQRLRELLGMERLQQLYEESKINLCAMVDGGGGAEALEELEARGLAALVPGLRVRAALQRQLAADPRPAPLYRWIKSNVEASVRGSAAFVSTLVALLADHVTRHAHTATPNADKESVEKERALVEQYAGVLRALLHARPDLQLAAVYAVQLHAHSHQHPKGMVLRWFMNLYNLEVCEEEAFLRWREDLSAELPGKGEALFQVNTWLMWLQEQDSEEEDPDE